MYKLTILEVIQVKRCEPSWLTMSLFLTQKTTTNII